MIKPAAGNPDDLVMGGLAARDQVDKGDIVATRGTDPQASNYPSLFPPDIPIGTVTGVDDPGTDTQQVHIKPFVDVRGLDFVEILRRTVGAAAHEPDGPAPSSSASSLLGLVLSVLQIAAVSQITLFGANADLLAARGRRRRACCAAR